MKNQGEARAKIHNITQGEAPNVMFVGVKPHGYYSYIPYNPSSSTKLCAST